jgi:protease-4
MTPDAEMIADRRRLRRKLSLWRVLAVAAAVAALVAVGLAAAGRNPVAPGQPQIARITVDGFIAGSDRMSELFKRVREANAVQGVVIRINSPGGTTTGSEELFRGIRDLADKKPLVAFVDGTAASGAYIAALASDHIVARETALVGSIGVLFQYPDASKLLDTIGVRVEEVKSAPLKAEPSPFKPTSPEARAALQDVVNDTYGWFKGLVADRRKMSQAELDAVASGRVFSGRQSVTLKLVDQIGAERDAVRWLERVRGVKADLPVRDWKPRSESGDFDLFSAAALGADAFGLEALASGLRRTALEMRARNLDGLLAVWHPGAEK